MTAVPTIRTGCDLVSVGEVERSVRRWGDRYLDRVFTPGELAAVGADRGPRLAARFAAKEAVVKALRLGSRMGPWTDVETVRDPGGGVAVRLGGSVADALDQVTSMDVSIAHEQGWAVAVVVVVLAPGPGAESDADSTSLDPPTVKENHHMSADEATSRIRAVLAETGGVTGVESAGESDDLYALGLTSHASVNVMLALEDEFDVEFPDELLRKSTFASIGAISDALEQIGVS